MKAIREAAMEYSTERVPDSYKFDTFELKGNEIKEEIYDSFRYGVEFAQEWYPLNTLTTPEIVVLVLYNDTEVTAYLTEITEELITSFGGLRLDKERIKCWRPIELK